MKYIISENRLNKLIGRFLDGLELKYQHTNYDNFVLYYDGKAAIKYIGEDESHIAILYISYPFEKLIENFTGLTSDEIPGGIIEWVNKNYNKNVKIWNWFLNM